jgi:hypothetical protein
VLGEDFQFNLEELLPLAPTAERSMDLYTAYDPLTRTVSLSATRTYMFILSLFTMTHFMVISGALRQLQCLC